MYTYYEISGVVYRSDNTDMSKADVPILRFENATEPEIVLVVRTLNNNQE